MWLANNVCTNRRSGIVFGRWIIDKNTKRLQGLLVRNDGFCSDLFDRPRMLKRLLIFIVLCFCGCKTLPPPIPTTSRDSTHTRIETRVDTFWRDRWHTEKQRGDTIFIHDSIYLEKIKYRDRVDSVIVCDSVPYPVEVAVPVRERNRYDKFTARGFWVLVCMVMLYIAWRLFRTKIRAFLDV